MKNNIFDFGRFMLVLKKDVAENWRKQAIIALSLFGVMLIFYMFNSISDYQQISYNLSAADYAEKLNREYVSYGTIMFILTFLAYISLMMDPISSKRKRTTYLIFPASSFEKFLVRAIQHTLGFLITFFVAFYLMDIVRVAICSVSFPDMDVRFIDLKAVFGSEHNKAIFSDWNTFIFAFSWFVLALSLFALGSTFWQKNAIVKNAVAFFILLFVFFSYNALLTRTLSDSENVYHNAFLNPNIFFEESSSSIMIPICFALSAACWVLAYFRFKETEIIQRW